jgi:formate dehydrogenase maturation protein FdhE
MAKKQSFSDKASKKRHVEVCPVCDNERARVKWIKAVKSDSGVRYRTVNIGVCKCNQAEVYG